MTKSLNRPERITPADLDVAVDEALVRAKQVTEMSKEELVGVSGGTSIPGKVVIGTGIE